MSGQNKEDNLYAMRHSLAHIMATAIKSRWPDVKLGIGPVIKDGFYYDIDLGEGRSISDENFKNLEKEMRKIIAKDQLFERTTKNIDESIQWAKDTNQPYKEELLNDLKRSGTTVASDLDAQELGTIADGDGALDEVSFYTNGDFTDLCRGPHVESTGKVGAFKLMRVSGSYWRGDENKPQMQRVYGVAFETQGGLDKHIIMLEEAKKRDHRRIGKEMDLFTISDLVGSGLPLYTPRGTAVIDALNEYSQSLRKNAGYQRVTIPHITKTDLLKKSGHWDKFGDELFLVKSQESSDEFVMKPMNCPHHTQIYAAAPRSYRDLPVKYIETSTTYRDEKSGELHGLSRVRAIHMDDSHVFARKDQIGGVVDELLGMANELYGRLDMKVKFRLSFRDEGEVYLGDESLWSEAQSTIEELAKKNQLDYYIEEGEAAFYGPKIDFIAVDAIEREWQVATVQLDFVLPERFELEYINNKGEAERPVMIHAALLGSLDRFLSVYIEHTAGKFPLWLAPEQVRIATVNQEEDTVKFAKSLYNQAKELGIRAFLDNDNESVGKKIRRAEVEKVPYTLVIGDKEIQSGQVVPRVRKDIEVDESEEPINIDNFFKTVVNESKGHVAKTSMHGHKTGDK